MSIKFYKYIAPVLALLLIVSFAGTVYAATFGKTTDGTNVQTFSGDRIYLSTFTPATSGTITACHGRVRVTDVSTSEIRVVIFSDNGGTPNGGTFLAMSDEVVVNWTTSADTLFEMSGANEIAITGGTPYWIGFWADDPGTPSYEYKRDNNVGVNHFAADAYPGGGTPTSPFASGGTANGPLNVYCDYTESGGGTPDPAGNSTVIFKDVTVTNRDGSITIKN